MYQRRKMALEARQNKPDLNCHYTKIKVTPIIIGIAHVLLHAYMHVGGRVSSRGNHFWGGGAPGNGCGFIYFLYNCTKFWGGGGLSCSRFLCIACVHQLATLCFHG